MLIDKNKLISKEWENIANYLVKDTGDSIKLAVIEAENVFIRVVNNKGYKAKSLEKKIEMALKEIKRPEAFLVAREKALKIKNESGADISDAYSALELINTYKEATQDILFNIIDEKKMESFKYRFWNFYYWFFTKRKIIFKYLIIFLAIIALMLFIADTDIGKNLFDLVIEKIHFILRMVLFGIFLVFLAVFFVTFSVIIWESRFKRNKKSRGGIVDN